MPIRDREHEPDSGQPRGRVRVLIVDDSALMRRLLSDLLSSAPEIEVVGVARDGREAVAQALRLKPDVITLDVEMPEVSGLEALPSILAVHEVPVVMVSALTQAGAEVTLQALELGAVDYMPKPERNQLAEMRAGRDLLVAKVLAAAQSRVRRPRRAATPPPSTSSATAAAAAPSPARRRPSRPSGPVPTPAPASGSPSATGSPLPCVVIGISTGGPQALSQVFPLLTPPLPPILVVQHMLAEFAATFAERLDRYTASTIRVKSAEEGDIVLPDQILIAPGGRHMSLAGHPPRVRVVLSDAPEVSGHRPSIDVLFLAAAKVYHSAAVGIIMTGMGRDGVEGCKAILAAGGFTLGQDEATSVVYGMNKAAFLEGAVKAQFALHELPAILEDVDALRPDGPSPSASD
ncbi:MAG: protein-glutamate methylesterase/protein-glutamine glutaminase [Isosphaeraceae bacterium]